MCSSTLESTEPRLSVRDVSVNFAGLRALTDVSFDLAADSLLGVIGPNGAGKTTLVNVITGFQRADRGAVILEGRDITKVDEVVLGRGVVRVIFVELCIFVLLTLG